MTVAVVPNDYTVSAIFICATNRLFGDTTACSNPVTGPPFAVSIPLSATVRPAGDYVLTASAVSTGGVEFDSRPVTIRVERSDPIKGLSVTPGIIDASDTRIPGSGQPRTIPLQVTASYADGSQVDVTESNHISYISGDDRVAQISSVGQVTLAPPNTLNTQITVQANTSDPSASDPFPVAAVVPVTNTSPVFGDLNGDGVVDQRDVTLMQNAVRQYVGQAVDPLNPFDLNHSGFVDVQDLRLLILQCDKLNCALAGP